MLQDERLFILGGFNGRNALSDMWLLDLAGLSYLPRITSFMIANNQISQFRSSATTNRKHIARSSRNSSFDYQQLRLRASSEPAKPSNQSVDTESGHFDAKLEGLNLSNSHIGIASLSLDEDPKSRTHEDANFNESLNNVGD
jgi:hypothetical protein